MAGMGKSLFMKHSFFAVQEVSRSRIPIFLELRTFNRMTPADLETRIFEDFEQHDTPISKEQVTHGAKSGLFLLLLDGFDELKAELMEYYQRYIVEFARKYPLCPIMMSTRQFDQLYSWPSFQIYK
jgi:hypothetical protein